MVSVRFANSWLSRAICKIPKSKAILSVCSIQFLALVPFRTVLLLPHLCHRAVAAASSLCSTKFIYDFVCSWNGLVRSLSLAHVRIHLNADISRNSSKRAHKCGVVWATKRTDPEWGKCCFDKIQKMLWNWFASQLDISIANKPNNWNSNTLPHCHPGSVANSFELWQWHRVNKARGSVQHPDNLHKHTLAPSSSHWMAIAPCECAFWCDCKQGTRFCVEINDKPTKPVSELNTHKSETQEDCEKASETAAAAASISTQRAVLHNIRHTNTRTYTKPMVRLPCELRVSLNVSAGRLLFTPFCSIPYHSFHESMCSFAHCCCCCCFFLVFPSPALLFAFLLPIFFRSIRSCRQVNK